MGKTGSDEDTAASETSPEIATLVRHQDDQAAVNHTSQVPTRRSRRSSADVDSSPESGSCEDQHTSGGNAAARSPNARGQESRAAILAAAKAAFAAEGFRGASLASVADAVGLSQPGVLHHFPSKVALLLAVLEDRDHEDGQLSSAHLDREGLEILSALGRLVEHNQESPNVVRLFSVLLGEGLAPAHPAHDYMTGRYRRIRSRVHRNLQNSAVAGDIQPGRDLEALAAVMVAVMDGLQFQWLLDPEVDMVRCYDVFRRIVEVAITQSKLP